jgi:hypothetical protein
MRKARKLVEKEMLANAIFCLSQAFLFCHQEYPEK